jgi:hypothetical protein
MQACALLVFNSTLWMVSFLANGFNTPFTMSMSLDGIILVQKHLLSLKFNFRIGTIYAKLGLFTYSGNLT